MLTFQYQKRLKSNLKRYMFTLCYKVIINYNEHKNTY